jgi:acetyl esterase/lipase
MARGEANVGVPARKGDEARFSQWVGETTELGPASLSTKCAAWGLRTTVKPGILAVTCLGRAVNGMNPRILQSVSLAGLDAPRWFTGPVSGTGTRRVALPTCDAEWIVPLGGRETKATLIYFHGSAFVALGLNSHRPLVSRLVRESGAPALNVAYGLRPVSELEQAIEQGVDAYLHAVAHGASPHNIVLAGDSAGGFIATLVALRIRDLGYPRPAGQVPLSPATDRNMEPKYAASKRVPDDVFPAATLKFLHDVYFTRNGTVEADQGPVELDLTGLAPFLIQVGSREVLRPDAELLAARLRSSGVHADLEIWDRAPHVFQMLAPFSQDATRAIDNIVAFVRDAGSCHEADRPDRHRGERIARLVSRSARSGVRGSSSSKRPGSENRNSVDLGSAPTSKRGR